MRNADVVFFQQTAHIEYVDRVYYSELTVTFIAGSLPGVVGHYQLGGRRQSSGAKIHSLSAAVGEAPITKVINIILAAQENSPLYISQALDKVCK